MSASAKPPPPNTQTFAQPGLPLSRLLDVTADTVQAVRDGRSLSDLMPRLAPDLRPGVQALSFHVLRHLGGAMEARALLAPRQPPPVVDALLITALALLWPAEEPPYADHTLVDQAVHAARRRVPAAAPFINAVLRRFLRERASVVAQAARTPAGAWHHPAWWVERLKRDWPREADTLLREANRHPPMTLRVNARRLSGADYLRRLAEAGIGARLLEGADSPTTADAPGHAVVLDRPRPLPQLPGFADGDVSVQDLAAQRAAPLLLQGAGLAPGARVLDACAAPGGKTAHLLELADLEVQALDVDATRLERVAQNLGRLNLHATLRTGDARRPADWWDGRPFDAILLDAPCTASGIVRRHPDVRWLRRPGDIDQLARTQAQMLESLWPLLAPGGRLLYATCSLFKAEGQDQIDAFLQRHGPTEAQRVSHCPGHLLPLADNSSLIPGNDGARAAGPALHDGFFYALLHKS